MTQKRKILIIAAVVVIITIAIIVIAKVSKDKKSNKEKYAAQRKLQADLNDPNVSTITDVDGTVVSKADHLSKSDLNSQIRKDKKYLEYYNSPQATNAYITIMADEDKSKGSWLPIPLPATDTLKVLMGLNQYELLALRDYFCNAGKICSLETYFSGYMSSNDYLKAKNYMNEARKRQA